MPRIYVACLAAYNNGILHGEWIDAEQTAEDLMQSIQDMLSRSPVSDAEEWAIHDHEGFNGYRLSEYTSMEDVAMLAEKLEEHGAAFVAFLDAFGLDVQQGADDFDNAFRGSWDSVEDYAENFLEDMGTFQNVPDMLRNYFDFGAFARDMQMGGDITTADDPSGGVFIFDSNW